MGSLLINVYSFSDSYSSSFETEHCGKEEVSGRKLLIEPIMRREGSNERFCFTVAVCTGPRTSSTGSKLNDLFSHKRVASLCFPTLTAERRLRLDPELPALLGSRAAG